MDKKRAGTIIVELAAFVKGFGKKDEGVIEKAIYTTKELLDLKFYTNRELDYKFYPHNGNDIFSPRLRIDLELLRNSEIDINPSGNLKEFYEIGKKLSKYNSRDLALAAQILWNDGNDLKENERRMGKKIVEAIRAKLL